MLIYTGSGLMGGGITNIRSDDRSGEGGEVTVVVKGVGGVLERVFTWPVGPGG